MRIVHFGLVLFGGAKEMHVWQAVVYLGFYLRVCHSEILYTIW
jgi:hypothetical protein